MPTEPENPPPAIAVGDTLTIDSVPGVVTRLRGDTLWLSLGSKPPTLQAGQSVDAFGCTWTIAGVSIFNVVILKKVVS
jgi:hypothetical protein